MLEQNIHQCIARLRGEADALLSEPEFRGNEIFMARAEALLDAAEAVEQAMREEEALVFDTYL